MIQVNLIPDVKYELLKARMLRVNIISICTIASIIAGGVVVLLAVYVFGVQSVATAFATSATESEFKKLSKVEDLSKMLTIQDQLSKLSSLDEDKPRTSRLFELLETVIPSGDNAITYSTLKLDTDEGVITIEAEAKNGYEALEVFKKTITETAFDYETEDGEPKSVDVIVSPVVVGDTNYGQNSNNERVLRFSLSFEYAPELLSTTSKNGKVRAPEKQNATDSARGVPKSLFTNTAEGN